MSEGEHRESEHSAAPPARRDRILFYAMIVLVLLGLGFAAELTLIHYKTHTDASYQAVCAVSEELNCETVAASPYSVFLGVPVSVWGLFGYSFCLALLLSGLRQRRPHGHWPLGLLSAFSAASVVVSVGLATIAITQIKSICLFCNGLYLVNFGLFALVGVVSYRSRLLPWKALMKDLGVASARLEIALLLLVPTTIGAVLLIDQYPRYWIQAELSSLESKHSGVGEEGDHWTGAPQPLLTIIEYTDYECPFCRKAHRAMREFLMKHPDEARLVHRHFPLDQACNPSLKRPFHGRACEFSLFAACAGEQAAFWPANDALFTQLEHTRGHELSLDAISAQLELDPQALAQCMSHGYQRQDLQNDISAGMELEINGTPTYVIEWRQENGERQKLKVEGAPSTKVLEEKLEEARKWAPTGEPSS
ncbi:MAG: vitamin K epoxide reductase family protein [Myxococcota bacterium]|nr:vitamin K epoxide reductase family protein [Myxococcota bacterium]